MLINDWSSDVCSSDRRLFVIAATWAVVVQTAEHFRCRSLVKTGCFFKAGKTNCLEHVQYTFASQVSGKKRVAERVTNEIGRASCRERVCQYVEISEVAVSTKNIKKYNLYNQQK